MLGFKTQELPKDFLKGEFFNVCAIQIDIIKDITTVVSNSSILQLFCKSL